MIIESLPFKEVAGSVAAPGLTFYSLATCHICDKAREYLQERGYAFRYVFVDELPPETKDRLKTELSSRHGTRVVFPALEIEERRIVLGFFRKAWDKALTEETGGAHG